MGKSARKSFRLPRETRRLFSSFVSQLETGEVPDNSTTKELADAFRKILSGSTDPQVALKLKCGRGRPRQTAGERHKRHAPIVSFIQKHIDADEEPHGSVGRAISAAAVRFGTRNKPMDEREIRRVWNTHGPFRQIVKILQAREDAIRDVAERIQEQHQALQRSVELALRRHYNLPVVAKAMALAN